MKGRIVGLIVAETKELGQVGATGWAPRVKRFLQNILIRN